MMTARLNQFLKQLLALRWSPKKDLLIVFLSCFLVTASLYTASIIIGPERGGGLPYFFLYAGLTALLFGIGIPVWWTVGVKKQSLSQLGLTRKSLFLCLGLQVILAAFELKGGMTGLTIPSFQKLLPLMALSLTIGLFEAIFWRGWVINRLEESFGFIPAALIGSALYAAYHVGYGMPLSEMVFLFFIGLMYAIVFRLSGSIFILWPIFQPAGQMITLVKDGLDLPVLAALGFFEALVLMGVLIGLANRIYQNQKKHLKEKPESSPVVVG